MLSMKSNNSSNSINNNTMSYFRTLENNLSMPADNQGVASNNNSEGNNSVNLMTIHQY